MTAVMLVGERQMILEILGRVLVREGISISMANSRSELESLLAAEAPDVVIFDHVGPIDLFELNPREFGFDGPVILMSRTAEIETALRLLQTDHFVRGHQADEVVLHVRTLTGTPG